ncbi:Cthe_2314 family HEPN domain-containing protein [Eubacterium limosum]|uniref:Cthe_2314 family HEPN domain-containing protein n=1 Tax=Eubacterium limosum TaxID=1736 RepID=UPI001062927E|nr:Cthe_2314 family HEPN domain-containing protein [Eubacterium limosum]
MNKSIETEISYLQGKISEVTYDSDRFKIMIGEDGSFWGGSFDDDGINKFMQCKTLYDTLIDLDWKIKVSFQESIKYTYSDPVQKEFSIIKTDTEEEKLSYYYIENALFRTLTLWDILAQLYRINYDINVPKDRVYHKKIFNPRNIHNEKFKKKAIEINNYFEQDDNTDIVGEWKGNYAFVNSLRNKMTHRNSPNVSVMSDFDLNFKNHPSYQLKRIVEDYAVVSKYIREILYIVEKDFIDSL